MKIIDDEEYQKMIEYWLAYPDTTQDQLCVLFKKMSKSSIQSAQTKYLKRLKEIAKK
jgi:hypothetical protein